MFVDRIIVDTGPVGDVGAQMKQDAQALMGPGPNTVEDFQNTLNRINDNNFPSQLFQALYQFTTVHTAAYTAVSRIARA
ncbi:MAG: hypothetical protein M3Z08_02795 [Chloroflexota bacterium]|nr:hypothetical protein [Chloroflexota bacterium]